MQNITDSEFQREVEALKSHRRISVNRPLLDPDLPDLAAAHGGGREILGSPDRLRKGVDLSDEGAVAGAGATSGARQAFTARRRGAGAGEDGRTAASPTKSKPSTTAADEDTPLAPKDPSHLFWVPASMHPEISPSDFRKFLQEHASRAVREHAAPESPTSASSTSTPSMASAAFTARRSSSTSSGATTPPPSPADIVSRSTSIARRGSTLRRQYRPENDAGDSDDAAARLTRGGGSSRRGGPPPLSIDDLQRLEQLAEEASKSQDTTQLRSVLRRTMSLGVGASELDQVDAIPPEGDDEPLIVPRPGQILRRAARTKIRKSSFSGGEAGAGRGSGRRRNTPSGTEDAPMTDMASVALAAMQRRQSDLSEVSSQGDEYDAGSSRPLSDEATDSIVDAYSRDSYLSEDGSQRTSVTSLADSLAESSVGSTDGAGSVGRTLPYRSRSPSPPVTPTQSTLAPSRSYFDTHKAPQEDAEGQQQQQVSDPSRYSPEQERDGGEASWKLRPVAVSHVPPTPSFEKARRPAPSPPLQQQTPSTAAPAPVRQLISSSAPPAQYQPLPAKQAPAAARTQEPPALAPIVTGAPPPPPQRAGKEKKSSFASWFGIGKDEEAEAEQRAGKLRKKDKERERKEREQAEYEQKERDKEREKDSSSFLGALFGSKKKGGDEAQTQSASRVPDGHITAGSLLDRGMQGSRGQYANYYRYPIHIERAVYRLSHIKLANPRRPLYEQVLISNLMFWYLSIINRSQQQQQQQQAAAQAQQIAQQPAQPVVPIPASQAAAAEELQAAASAPIVAQPFPAVLEEPIGIADSAPVEHVEQRAQPQPKAKRSGLVKPGRAPPGSRSAEMAIPAAAYGAQHRQINNDLAREQREQHAAQHAAPVIAVGKVVDPRVLGIHAAGYQPPPPSSNGIGRLPPGAAPPAGRPPSTSPTLSAQHVRGTQQDARSASSGAWLGSGGGAAPSGRPTHNGRSVSAAAASDEHTWLGASSSASSSRSRSKSPQPGRSSEPIPQAWSPDGDEQLNVRKGVRGSDPVEHLSSGFYYSSADGASQRDNTDGAARIRATSYGNQETQRIAEPRSQPGSRPHTAGSDASGSYGSAQGDAQEPLSSRPHTKSSTSSGSQAPQAPPVSIPMTSGTAALIEAARSSQSRRR